MEKYKIDFYLHSSPNDQRRVIKNISDETLYLAYISMGGSGFGIEELRPGREWREGADEFVAVYDTREEAEKGIDKYME